MPPASIWVRHPNRRRFAAAAVHVRGDAGGDEHNAAAKIPCVLTARRFTR
jgi:hypothetical protein